MKKELYEIDGYEFVTYFHLVNSELLCEAKYKGELLIKNRSFFKSQPQIPDGEYHVHVFEGSNQIFAFCKDRTNTDNYLGVRLYDNVFKSLVSRYNGLMFEPNHVLDACSQLYFLLPIESLSNKQLFNELEVLTEERGLNDIYMGRRYGLGENIDGFKLIDKQLSQRLDNLYMELVKRKAIKLTKQKV